MPASYDVCKIAEKLNVKVSALYALSNNKKTSYKRIVIKKRDGSDRVLKAPCGFLKYVQRRLLAEYLYYLEPSGYSYAYEKGKNIKDNAAKHLGAKKVLKMDIEDFFGSVDSEKVFCALKKLGLDRPATGLITELCTNDGCLPQGAPTSPHIANLVMKDFDERVGEMCENENITYTRYCDDMTFSGDFDEHKLKRKVEKTLYFYGFLPNAKKSRCFYYSQNQQVTGVTVNEKLQLSKAQRRKLKQQIYYALKFGGDSTSAKISGTASRNGCFLSLLGRVSYALWLNPGDKQLKELKNRLLELKNHGHFV